MSVEFECICDNCGDEMQVSDSVFCRRCSTNGGTYVVLATFDGNLKVFGPYEYENNAIQAQNRLGGSVICTTAYVPEEVC